MTAVTAVVVNWNGEEFLPSCLAALEEQEGVAVEIAVVDNGSTDGSIAYLQSLGDRIRLFQNEVNNYTGANNLGVAHASHDLVLLLNTDAVLDPGAMGHLVEALAADPAAAGAAPKVVDPKGRLYTTGIHEREDLYWVDRDLGAADPGGSPPPEEVYGISGCCALFRKEAWDAVGGQDEDFHMYYEDVDLCLRLRAADRRLLYVPAARVVHEGHGSIRKTPHGKDILGERNRLYVLARHFPAAFAQELVRSPWFAQAPEVEDAAVLANLAAKLAERTGGDGRDALLAAFATGTASLMGRDRAAPVDRTVLDEREQWIVRLLKQVAWLRFWRLPGRRLRSKERDFIARVEGRRRS